VAWVVGYMVALSVAFIPDLNICERVGQRWTVVGGLRQGSLRMWPGYLKVKYRIAASVALAPDSDM
jgi:hypothetical protein